MSWTRRQFLATTSVTGAGLLAGRGRAAHAQGKAITASHSVSTFVYGQHLVAKEKKFFEEEGLSLPSFIVPGGGAKVVQALAAGQAMFALGDSNHPLKTTEKGKDALMLFATDTRCSYANVVVRKELWDRGVKSVEALADAKLVGRKAVVAATAIGSGTHVYGVYVLKGQQGPRRQDGERPRGVGGRRRLDHDAGRAQGREVRRDHGGARVAVGHRGRGLRQGRSTTCRTRRRGIASSAAPSRSRWATCSRRRSRSRPTSCRATSTPASAPSSGSTGPRTRRSSSCCTSRTWTRSRARSSCAP